MVISHRIACIVPYASLIRLFFAKPVYVFIKEWIIVNWLTLVTPWPLLVTLEPCVTVSHSGKLCTHPWQHQVGVVYPVSHTEVMAHYVVHFTIHPIVKSTNAQSFPRVVISVNFTVKVLRVHENFEVHLDLLEDRDIIPFISSSKLRNVVPILNVLRSIEIISDRGVNNLCWLRKDISLLCSYQLSLTCSHREVIGVRKSDEVRIHFIHVTVHTLLHA